MNYTMDMLINISTIYYIILMDAKQKSTQFLQNRLKTLQNQMSELFPMMRGSVVTIGMKNKQPKYSLNIEGKTKLMYLGRKKQGIAKKWIDNYRKHMKLIDEMTLINMEIIRRIKIEPDKNKKLS
jgi:hypothetical protein